MKRILSLTAAVAIAFAFAACKKTESTDRIASTGGSEWELTSEAVPVINSEPVSEPAVSSEPEIIHVSGIKLSAYERTLTEGERFMPIVTMSPQNAANKAEKWETSDAAIATVNNYGNITAKKRGQLHSYGNIG